MTRVRRWLLFLVSLPSVAFAAGAPNTFQQLAQQIVEILDTATFTLIIFGLVMYFWGMIRSIPHFGDEKGAERRKSFFVWGLMVLFVMVSIWGIIVLLQNTLFGDNPYDPSSGAPAREATTYCDAFGDCSL